jgi:hypothetical protein
MIYTRKNLRFGTNVPLGERNNFWQQGWVTFSANWFSIRIVAFLLIVLVSLHSVTASASPSDEILRKWYGLSLSLIRHTATYSPPVASRALAYLGVTSFEAVASGSPKLQSLAGQLNGLKALPARENGQSYDEVAVLEAALAAVTQDLFNNTGPSGQQAIQRLEDDMRARAVTPGTSAETIARSTSYGRAIAGQIIVWSHQDGGAVIENMGFPLAYALDKRPGHWAPTNPLARQQQMPLLPNWGKNRPFAMPEGAVCPLPPPLEYSEEPTSAFYKDALETYQTGKSLTDDQKAIAFFWTDDAMASPTPAGHWSSILLQIAEHDHLPLEKHVDALARLGVAMADAFIGCWHEKYRYDLVRPMTYIRKMIAPDWVPFLLTPPFPEYPSGHSTLSAAAATVLASVIGDPYSFTDHTRERDAAIPRSVDSFWAAAEEAEISRLYGGIHFRAAIERGFEQGRCIGAYALALKTAR